MNEVLSYLGGFLFNFVVIFVIVRFVYFLQSPDKSNVFTFLGFSSVIYFVIHLMTNVELSIGVGFGLFALFSILRYRTETIQIRDMTYLFIILALSVMNALMIGEGMYLKVISANLVILAITYFLEKGYMFEYSQKKHVVYENIELIVPERREELLKDLRKRLGISSIYHVEVGNVNFLKDSTELLVFYKK